MAAKYDLRKQQKKDYKKLADTPLPRTRPARKDDALYELEVLEEDTTSGRVKVHYTGYGSEHDEWRDKNDIVVMEPSQPGKYTYNLYNNSYVWPSSL